MPLIDISLALNHATPVYPGDPLVEITAHNSISGGDLTNVSLLRFSAHAGTHLDAPAHFYRHAEGLAAVSLDTMIGEASVVEIELHAAAMITADHIAHLVPEGTIRVLFKTHNSTFWAERPHTFRERYTHLTPQAAQELIRRGVRLVGIDYLSVDAFDAEDFPVHKTLLEKGVCILEGLDLREARAGVYELLCLPLKITGGAGDAAPARAVLRSPE